MFNLEHFDGIFTSASERVEELRIPVIQLHVIKRQVTCVNPHLPLAQFYRHRRYTLLLDAGTTGMQSRFSNETVTHLSELTYFIPAVIVKSAELPVQKKRDGRCATVMSVASSVSRSTHENDISALSMALTRRESSES